jgi:hypothetical protein
MSFPLQKSRDVNIINRANTLARFLAMPNDVLQID